MKLLNDFFRITATTADGCTVQFNPDHVIYRAHFPGNPITPGVCIIQMITEVLEQRLGCHLTLHAVKNVKFIVPVSPLQQPSLDVHFAAVQAADGQCSARGTITDAAGTVFTKFSMQYHQHE